MEIPFVLRGLDGRVTVTYERNEQPESLGCPPASRGFPVCEATVEYPPRGYGSVLGWVQLVRSDDNESGGQLFEIDPLAFLGDLPHPFCWLGINPTLFDVPSRSLGRDLDWAARSFLCVPDQNEDDQLEVQALLGFTWGFNVRNERIFLVPPRTLGQAEWNEHGKVLSELYPNWGFPSGFRGQG